VSAPKFDHKAFDARLVALGIFSAELAQIIGRDVEQIDRWREGRGRPDGEARIQLRVLDNDHVAGLAVERVRTLRTLPLRGEAMAADGVEHTAAAPVKTGGAL
jgi:hypothetical protein